MKNNRTVDLKTTTTGNVLGPVPCNLELSRKGCSNHSRTQALLFSESLSHRKHSRRRNVTDLS